MLQPPLSDVKLLKSELTKPFWEAAKDGRLLYQRCSGCDRAFFRPEIACPHCRSREWTWQESKGEGTLYSFSVMHRAATPAFTAPFIFAAVELDEGYPMFTNLVGLEPDDAKIGMRVKVLFHAVGDDTLPYFAPA